MSILKSPYPYFGGKAKVAGEIWKRLGDVPVYVEPFFGSGAVWLARPKVDEDHLERLNDLHGFIPNFWRAIQHAPDEVAKWANNPAFECDLHAKHLWLAQHKNDLPERLMADPDFYDAKIAGWWVWGLSWWIGSGWCSGEGGWTNVDGKLARAEDGTDGISRRRMHQRDAGMGIAAARGRDLTAYFAQLSGPDTPRRGSALRRLVTGAEAGSGVGLEPQQAHPHRDRA